MSYKTEIHQSKDLSSERRSELEQWFEKEFGHIPFQWTSPSWYVLALSDSTLIGRLGIIERKASVNGKLLEVAGVSGVITRSEWRRRGVARNMVKNAVEFIANRLNINFALLLCRQEVVPVYTKLGWEIVDGPTTFDQPNGKRMYPKLTMIFECGKEQWPIGPIDLCGLPW